jgi:predicted house-cleaning NTP pyrophosphatase (Maf/HAM1 superfamily)
MCPRTCKLGCTCLAAPAALLAAGIMDELAAQYGFQYEVAKAGIDESAIRHDDARQLVLALAHAKADAIRAALAQRGAGGTGLLITCDQVRLPRWP